MYNKTHHENTSFQPKPKINFLHIFHESHRKKLQSILTSLSTFPCSASLIHGWEKESICSNQVASGQGELQAKRNYISTRCHLVMIFMWADSGPRSSSIRTNAVSRQQFWSSQRTSTCNNDSLQKYPATFSAVNTATLTADELTQANLVNY